jgi:hypothetical protein
MVPTEQEEAMYISSFGNAIQIDTSQYWQGLMARFIGKVSWQGLMATFNGNV